MPELVFFRRGEELLRFGLEKAPVVLGRGERSDVVIPDPEVSRQHVALRFDGEHCQLEDLSGKGTRVRGELVQTAALSDGADITLGQWRAIFRLRSATGEQQMTDEGGTRTAFAARALAQPQEAQLRVRQQHEETIYPLRERSFTIGKEPGNDLVLADPFISARHLKILRRDQAFHVVDAHSTNGTFLGPVRIYDVEVTLPTTLRMGETELVLEAAGAEERPADFHGILGKDPSVRRLIEMIERVAPSSAAVTLLGESGTGKELAARALHRCSPRAARPLIPVNCAAISKELMESELFGHEKGAFTGAVNAHKGAFEEADGGTLFLDEVGELPLDLQAKLLRALESGEIKRVGASRPQQVDVRIIAATNRDLLSSARAGTFREDLYYRLCVVPIHLPPLRNRKQDVAALAENFLRAFSPKGQPVPLSASAQERLQQHPWPGNVRELRNVVHRALLLRKGAQIDASDLSFDQELNHETGIAVPELPPGMTLEAMMEKLERQIVEATLRRCNNNRERVARELGVARSTLFKRLKDWGLTRQEDLEG